jgi:hypothetical protein
LKQKSLIFSEFVVFWKLLIIKFKKFSSTRKEIFMDRIIINDGYRAPSIAPINQLASSLATLDIMRFLGGFGEVSSYNKRIGVWTHSLKIEEMDFAKNPVCNLCAQK